MKYKFDHDYHIHSKISLCSNDEAQTNEAILDYAKKNRLHTVVLTDHYWDDAVPGASGWYQKQPFGWIEKALPLPQGDGERFLFGCESDMNKEFTVGIPKERFSDFDFMIIPTTHLHMTNFTLTAEEAESNEARAKLWVLRFDELMKKDFPWGKVGVAHLACPLINRKSREDYLQTLDLIPSEEMERLFAKAAELGVGIELNSADMSYKAGEEERVLRMFKIAKNQGCKFYCGSDAHHPSGFERAANVYERAVNDLALTENDKFFIEGIEY